MNHVRQRKWLLITDSDSWVFPCCWGVVIVASVLYAKERATGVHSFRSFGSRRIVRNPFAVRSY